MSVLNCRNRSYETQKPPYASISTRLSLPVLIYTFIASIRDCGVSRSRGWRGTLRGFGDIFYTELCILVWAIDKTVLSDATGGVLLSMPGSSKTMCRKDTNVGTVESDSDALVKDPLNTWFFFKTSLLKLLAALVKILMSDEVVSLISSNCVLQ